MTNGTNWTENRTNRKRKTSLIPPHGGYRKLKSYQSAEIVFDLTKIFCEKFLSPRNRTNGTNWISRTNRTNGTDWTSRSFRQIEQMVQAARSGKQNIAEGSMASGTSKKTELKLVGVARASLEELLLDFEDFLRRRGLKKWGKSDPLAVEIRNLVYRSNRTCKTYWTYFE